MIKRVVLAALIVLPTAFHMPANAAGQSSVGGSVCECVLKVANGRSLIGSVEVTDGTVLALSRDGYAPVKSQVALFGGARLIAGPRSKGKAVFSGSCGFDLNGSAELGVRPVGNSFCIFNAKAEINVSDRNVRGRDGEYDDHISDFRDMERDHGRGRGRGRGCGRDHDDRRRGGDRDDRGDFWGHGHGSGHGGCHASR